MKEQKRKSIRARLVRVMMTLTAVAVFVVGTLLLYKSYIDDHKSMQEKLSVAADILGENASVAIEFNNADDAQAVMQSLKALKEVEKAGIYLNGQLFSSYSVVEGDQVSKVLGNFNRPEFSEANGLLYLQKTLPPVEGQMPCEISWSCVVSTQCVCH